MSQIISAKCEVMINAQQSSLHRSTKVRSYCNNSFHMSKAFFCPSPTAEVPIPQMVSCEQLPNENLSAVLDQKIVSPNRLLADTGSFARVVVGFPDLMVRSIGKYFGLYQLYIIKAAMFFILYNFEVHVCACERRGKSHLSPNSFTSYCEN